jgi:hypothetical protein
LVELHEPSTEVNAEQAAAMFAAMKKKFGGA